MIYPKALRQGDAVGLVCTSSYITEERKKQCVEAIQKLGYKVKVAENLTSEYHGYLAGDGKFRAYWLNKMFADKEVAGILCARGGFGSSDMMEYLDLEIIRRNPKVFMGYSDVTNLHLVLNQKCELVTFHGPMVSPNMVNNFDNETRASFFRAMHIYEFKNPKKYEIKVLKAGSCKEGHLIGGNLSLLVASLGTPYEVDTRDNILFIEEVGEDIRRIKRMVQQLKHAGKFERCRGVVLGQFTDCPAISSSSNDMCGTFSKGKSYGVLDVFREVLCDYDIPVLYNIQSGHDFPMMTLPLGGLCKLNIFEKEIEFL